MDSRLLIDQVVRQTTLLIAQLATSAGIRAPLAHLADQVFVNLASEIERQGISRKVAADMFGLALRGYQRRVARLRESATVGERTLWQAVLEYVVGFDTAVSRSQILAAFPRDEPVALVAVLSDLVASGLLYATGRGRDAAYRGTSSSDRAELLRRSTSDGLLHLVWLELSAPNGATVEELRGSFPDHAELLEQVVETLVETGRVQRDQDDASARYRASRVTIPAGSEAGWETAVFDHFRAVCTALASKLRRGGAARADDHLVGGTTLSFDLYAGHPYEHEVKGLLSRVRREAQDLWKTVADHNAAHPVPERRLERVIFYAGQNHIPNETSGGTNDGDMESHDDD